MQKTITLSQNDIQDNPFINAHGDACFYRKLVSIIGEPFGKNFDDISSLDCTRILVSSDIQDTWIEAMSQAGHPSESIMMTLANWGPKADDSLEAHTVVLQDGALQFNDGTDFPTAS